MFGDVLTIAQAQGLLDQLARCNLPAQPNAHLIGSRITIHPISSNHSSPHAIPSNPIFSHPCRRIPSDRTPPLYFVLPPPYSIPSH